MRSLVGLALMGVAACGRIGFEPYGTESGDGGVSQSGDGGVSDGRQAEDGRPGLPDGSSADGSSADGALPDAPSGAVLTSVADTALNSFSPDLNYGGATSFNVRSDAVSTFTGLVRFDVSGLAGGTATDAEIRLTTTSTGGVSSGRVALFEVLEDWDEGSESGSAGEASWNDRAPGVPWTAPGCGPGSRSSTELGDFVPDAAGSTYAVAISPGVVQGWIDDPASNFGVALVAEGFDMGETAGFGSRESGADAPQLLVTLAP